MYMQCRLWSSRGGGTRAGDELSSLVERAAGAGDCGAGAGSAGGAGHGARRAGVVPSRVGLVPGGARARVGGACLVVLTQDHGARIRCVALSGMCWVVLKLQ